MAQKTYRTRLQTISDETTYAIILELENNEMWLGDIRVAQLAQYATPAEDISTTWTFSLGPSWSTITALSVTQNIPEQEPIVIYANGNDPAVVVSDFVSALGSAAGVASVWYNEPIHTIFVTSTQGVFPQNYFTNYYSIQQVDGYTEQTTQGQDEQNIPGTSAQWSITVTDGAPTELSIFVEETEVTATGATVEEAVATFMTNLAAALPEGSDVSFGDGDILATLPSGTVYASSYLHDFTANDGTPGLTQTEPGSEPINIPAVSPVWTCYVSTTAMEIVDIQATMGLGEIHVEGQDSDFAGAAASFLDYAFANVEGILTYSSDNEARTLTITLEPGTTYNSGSFIYDFKAFGSVAIEVSYTVPPLFNSEVGAAGNAWATIYCDNEGECTLQPGTGTGTAISGSSFGMAISGKNALGVQVTGSANKPITWLIEATGYTEKM